MHSQKQVMLHALFKNIWLDPCFMIAMEINSKLIDFKGKGKALLGKHLSNI
jgi:hypothetical protein